MKTDRSTVRAEESLLVWVGTIYVIAVALAVAYSWIIGVHRFDLGLTVSIYVALHVWTSVFYFLAATAICGLLGWYVWKTPMYPIQRVVYLLTLLCVFGCAWFPCNGARSALSEDIHNYFSYALVILVALSFFLMWVLPGNRRRKLYGLGSTVFAVFFIAAFALRIRVFKDTIFIWENLIIVLLFFELYLERPESG